MIEFGELKSKILATLVESYENKDKTNINKIIKLIKENKDFMEMYLFYEDFEDLKEGFNVGGSNVYLNILESVLKEKKDKIKNICESINKLLPKNINYTYNKIYESLDLLSTQFTLKNIEQKNVSRKLLESYIEENKIIKEEEEVNEFTEKQELLNTILANNFNVLYGTNLSEEEKNEFKEIISLDKNTLEEKYKSLYENIVTKIDGLLTEETENESLKDKLLQTKKEIGDRTITRLNYFKLKELSDGFGL